MVWGNAKFFTARSRPRRQQGGSAAGVCLGAPPTDGGRRRRLQPFLPKQPDAPARPVCALSECAACFSAFGRYAQPRGARATLVLGAHCVHPPPPAASAASDHSNAEFHALTSDLAHSLPRRALPLTRESACMLSFPA